MKFPLTHLCLLVSLFTLKIGFAQIDVFLGTTGRNADGIYHAKLDLETGQLSDAKRVYETRSPGFLTMHPSLPVLYAVSGSRENALVEAIQVSETGALELLNQSASPASNSAHIAVHPTGTFLLTAHYGAGAVSVYPLSSTGQVLESTQLIQHTGPASAVNSRRQRAPHPHWVGFSPDGRFAYVPDLGMDTIEIYSVDQANIEIQKIGAASTVPGGGPRHMRFSKDGRFVYLLNELTVSISIYSYDAATGLLGFVKEVPTLSEDEKAGLDMVTGSEILVSSSGEFVYTGNRGHDSVSSFRVGEDGAMLKRFDLDPVQGNWPRNINLSPDGKWLLAGGQRSGTVSVLSVDPETGELAYLDQIGGVPDVSCILFHP